MRQLYGRYLAAQCLLERKHYDECVKVLRDNDANDEADAQYLPRAFGANESPHESGAQRQRLLAQVCLVRGRAFVGVETRLRGIYWLRRALQLDPHCSEAFAVLCERRMLSAHSEARLCDALCAALTAPHDAWLRDFYIASMQREGAVSARADANARRAVSALVAQHALERSTDVLAARAQAALALHEYETAAQLAARARLFDPQPDR